jgi:hypothetical protein
VNSSRGRCAIEQRKAEDDRNQQRGAGHCGTNHLASYLSFRDQLREVKTSERAQRVLKDLPDENRLVSRWPFQRINGAHHRIIQPGNVCQAGSFLDESRHLAIRWPPRTPAERKGEGDDTRGRSHGDKGDEGPVLKSESAIDSSGCRQDEGGDSASLRDGAQRHDAHPALANAGQPRAQLVLQIC